MMMSAGFCSVLRRQQQRLISYQHDAVRWSSNGFPLRLNLSKFMRMRICTASCIIPHNGIIVAAVRPLTCKIVLQPLLWSYHSRFLSTDEPGIRRYLSRESFPLGSLDLHDGRELLKEIQCEADKGTPESVKLAFQLLDRLFQEVIFVQNKDVVHRQPSNLTSWRELFKPIDELVYKVVNAWNKNGSNISTANLSPRNVFEMVKQWETGLPYFRSDAHTNNMMIHATVSLQEPELAEEILNYILESNKNGQTNVDVVNFNSAIDAWAKSGHADAPQRAEALLKKMIDLSDTGWVEVAPDVITFSSVITTWANSNHEKAPHHTEELLRNMIARGLRPNEISYSSVLTTWARSKEAQAAGRAHAILKHMVKLYKDGSNDFKPQSHCYAAVINAYAILGDAHQAERLLVEQIELYQSTKDRAFLPNNVSCNSVINAWAKSGRPEAPQIAEKILQRMQDLSDKWNEPSLRPDVKSFTSVLDAWARSKDRDAPMRCEQILQRMQDLYEMGYTDSKPDVFSFSTVLNSWAKSSRDDAPERAEAILRHMERLHNAGNEGVKPNIICYNTVMNAWARSGRRDAAERTQVMFDDLLQKYADGDQEMRPDLLTYTTLITAWGRSKHEGRAARAQAAFDHMLDRYQSGSKELRPDVKVYNALAGAWAKAGNPEMAEQVLRETESNGVMTDVATYGVIMGSWTRSGSANAVDRMFVLYDDMKRKYVAGAQGLKPDHRILDGLLYTWKRSSGGRQDRLSKAQGVYEDVLARFRSGEVELKALVDRYSYLMKTA